MVERKVVKTVKRYLQKLGEDGLPVSRAVLYGSQARGTAREDSDIDLLLLSQEFDPLTVEHETRAWRTAFDIDWRIEPVLYGEKEYEVNDWHPLILVAKQEGIEIRASKSSKRSGKSKKRARK